MAAPRDCPGIECWQALFGNTVTPDQREHYERHLASCPACQERLDRAVECEGTLRRLGRKVGDPTLVPADPTLQQVLERLQETKYPDRNTLGEPADLYFLRPADRPGVLGMLGAYEVQEVIGVGGMGVVLKAYEPALHRLVAIKVMAAAVAGSATARRRFTREAQAAAAVCHDHVVAVHGVHETDGLPYLVMQFVEGESLQDRLDLTGPLEVVDIVRIGMQTAAGLAAAHGQGLIHRDIKPANLLLEERFTAENAENAVRKPEGEQSSGSSSAASAFSAVKSCRVKITDFGLARTAADVQLTQAGVVAGTPEYMAPEQARGEQVDHRADLFSLGSVLYACCIGRPPFRGATPLAVLRQVSDQAPVPIRELKPDLPAWLEGLIARLLAKDPADRCQSAAEVAGLLEGYLAHLRQPARVPVPELPASRRDVSAARLTASAASQAPLGSRGLPSWLAALLLLSALGLSLVLLAQALLPGREVSAEREYDFRGRPLPPNMVPSGPQADQFIKGEAEGLRITLPRNRDNSKGVVLSMPLEVEGDFEITTAFEILHADEPAPGARSYGVGVLMSLNEAARIGRLVRAEGKQVVTWDRWEKVDGNPRFLSGALPGMGQVGRLRLQRTGTTLHFLWAPETSGDNFQDFYQCEFGADGIKLLRLELIADTGGQPGTLDVRLLDLKVRSGNLPAGQAAVPGEGRPTRSKPWLTAGGILGLALLLFLAVVLVARRRRAAVRGKQAKPDADAPAVSFPCPGCGKTLKTRAALMGKKVKCVQCGKPVLVPGTRAGEPGRTSP